jgi:hypothetical protein
MGIVSSITGKPSVITNTVTTPIQIVVTNHDDENTHINKDGGDTHVVTIIHPTRWDSTNFEQEFQRYTPRTSPTTSSSSSSPTAKEEEHDAMDLGEGCNIKSSEIQLGDIIGEGNFGRVYRAVCRGKAVAVKIISVDKCGADFVADFSREVEVMSKVNHPNICLYMGGCTSIPGRMMLVTPLYKVSLDRLLYSHTAIMSLPLRMRIARDVALGMTWLHNTTPMMVHSDLKTPNILLDDNYNAVVCDFGQTEILRTASHELTTWGGSILYMAPEKLLGAGCNEKVDVYAYGLVLWELIARRQVYAHYVHCDSIATFVGAIVERHERPAALSQEDCPSSLMSLMEACWQAAPASRPSFQRIVEILDHIVHEVTLPDKLGRKFWLDNFERQTQVPWKLFKERFARFTNHPPSSLFWLKPLLAKRAEKMATTVSATLANMEHAVTTPQDAGPRSGGRHVPELELDGREHGALWQRAHVLWPTHTTRV